MKAVKTLTLGLALASGLSLIAQPKFEDVARQAKEEVESDVEIKIHSVR